MTAEQDSLKTKKILLQGGPPCDHRGYLVPMVMIPQVVTDQGKTVNILVTQSARCVKCPVVYSFGIPEPPPTPNAESGVPHPAPLVTKIPWVDKFKNRLKALRKKP